MWDLYTRHDLVLSSTNFQNGHILGHIRNATETSYIAYIWGNKSQRHDTCTKALVLEIWYVNVSKPFISKKYMQI